MKKNLKVIVLGICSIIIICMIKFFAVSTVRISGTSMEPALSNGELVFVKRNSAIKKGDIVLIKFENNSYMVKRIIGTQGDLVNITYDNLLVNNIGVDHKINNVDKNYSQTVIVPEGKVFVMGDNRLESYDSRNIGCIAAEKIVGLIVIK